MAEKDNIVNSKQLVKVLLNSVLVQYKCISPVVINFGNISLEILLSCLFSSSDMETFLQKYCLLACFPLLAMSAQNFLALFLLFALSSLHLFQVSSLLLLLTNFCKYRLWKMHYDAQQLKKMNSLMVVGLINRNQSKCRISKLMQFYRKEVLKTTIWFLCNLNQLDP